MPEGQVDWCVHDDSTVDVAAIPISWSGYDLKAWPIVGGLVTEEAIKGESIGPGEDIFIAGLFSRHPGKIKNIPIIRVGNIAAMPEDPIVVKDHCSETDLEIDAYLVETRSFGGLSGSPVFIHLGIMRRKDDGTKTKIHIEHSEKPEGRLYLLGLVYGHYAGSDRLDPAEG